MPLPSTLLGILPWMAVAAPAAAELPPPSRWVPGHVVVHAPGATNADLAELAASQRCQLARRLGGWHPYFLLSCEAQGDMDGLLAALVADPRVQDATPDLVGQLHATPDDLGSAQWQHDVLDSEDAWDVHTGDPDVVVAVIDVGSWNEHEDLAANAWTNGAEKLCDDGKDDDGNGYVDDCGGWDAGEDDGDPDPRDLPSDCPPMHGTFAAGLVAAVGDNGTGITGVVWNGSAMAIKMVTEDCLVSQSGVMDAVLYAADNGALVGNMSFSFSHSNVILENAFRYADGLGMISTISAGNDGLDLDADPWYPAAYELEHGIVVAATTSSDALASWSNYGETLVHLAAPGHELYSLGVDSSSDYETASGTSFSAPLVAGAAALVWSAYPELHAEEVVASILDGVEPLSGLDCASSSSCVSTGGRLHLPGALEQAALWMETVELELESWSVQDSDDGEAWGDGDGLAERGETFRLLLRLGNAGHAASGSLALALTGEAEALEITQADADGGSVDAGGSAETAAFLLSFSAACTQDIEAELTVTATDGDHDLSATISLPLYCQVDEDGDGSLYPDDCDETDADIHPGAEETCDERDEDCDGEIDEDAVDMPAWYADLDGDGYGDPEAELLACEQASDNVAVEHATDCDDADAEIHPEAEESCNGVDDDCDGLSDDEDDPVAGTSTWYRDDDHDGYGVERHPTEACEQPEGYAADFGDCDDDDPDMVSDCPTRTRRSCSGCAASPRSLGAWLLVLVPLALRRRG